MTNRPTTLTARTIGETENALQAILRKSLEGSGLQYHDWVALKLICETEPAITRQAALHEMTHGLKVDETTASNVIDDLRAKHVMTVSGDHLETTTDGAALYRGINDKIRTNALQMWDGIAPNDLATAFQVLTTIKDRANTILAG